MFFTLNSNLKNHLQKILASPLPLLLLGGIILIQYLYISIFSGNIFQGDVFSVMDRFTFSFFSEIITRFWLITILFFIAVGISFWQSAKSYVKRNHWIVAIVFFLLFCSILIATNPIASQDVFWNLFQGEIFTSYHQNPYISAPENFSNETYLNNIPDWKNFTMTHGPLWTLIISSITAIFPNNIIFQILALRIALFSVLAVLIYFIINLIKKTNPGWAFPAFIALSWQPLLLVNTVNDCHNDILVGAGIIIGLFLITQSKYLKGCAVLWLAVLVKYIALLLFPLVAILILRKHGLRASMKIGLKIILICAILSIIFYYPFDYGAHVFNGLSQHSELFSNYTNLPPAPFWILTFNSSILQKNKSNQTSAFLITQIICIALFILTYFYIISKNFYDKNLFKKGFLILSAFLILAPIWFMSWYLIWLIPLAIILGPLFTAFVLIWGAISFPYPFPLLQSLFPVLFFATITYILIKKNNIIINSSKYPTTSWNKIAVLLKENRK